MSRNFGRPGILATREQSCHCKDGDVTSRGWSARRSVGHDWMALAGVHQIRKNRKMPSWNKPVTYMRLVRRRDCLGTLCISDLLLDLKLGRMKMDLVKIQYRSFFMRIICHVDVTTKPATYPHRPSDDSRTPLMIRLIGTRHAGAVLHDFVWAVGHSNYLSTVWCISIATPSSSYNRLPFAWLLQS